MAFEKLVFRIHAIQRMFARGITVDDVRHVLKTGEIIEEYPEDLPYPSYLMLGWKGSEPIHVVAADNKESEETIIITAYRPSDNEWEDGFKRRKKR